MSGPLHVSHLLIVTNTQVGPALRIMRTPKGPTLTFRIHSYSLCQDILSSVKKQLNADKMYKYPPLIVLNNFTSDENHMKLMATMFQNMFPTINVTKVNMYAILCIGVFTTLLFTSSLNLLCLVAFWTPGKFISLENSVACPVFYSIHQN